MIQNPEAVLPADLVENLAAWWVRIEPRDDEYVLTADLTRAGGNGIADGHPELFLPLLRVLGVAGGVIGQWRVTRFRSPYYTSRTTVCWRVRVTFSSPGEVAETFRLGPVLFGGIDPTWDNLDTERPPNADEVVVAGDLAGGRDGDDAREKAGRILRAGLPDGRAEVTDAVVGGTALRHYAVSLGRFDPAAEPDRIRAAVDVLDEAGLSLTADATDTDLARLSTSRAPAGTTRLDGATDLAVVFVFEAAATGEPVAEWLTARLAGSGLISAGDAETGPDGVVRCAASLAGEAARLQCRDLPDLARTLAVFLPRGPKAFASSFARACTTAEPLMAYALAGADPDDVLAGAARLARAADEMSFDDLVDGRFPAVMLCLMYSIMASVPAAVTEIPAGPEGTIYYW